ncbi:MAG: aminomethyl transferase family protein [Gammaproteobacteria bacterium]|nr:aminomethyl transferase family protein [Gammaproteobacteria bacterium]
MQSGDGKTRDLVSTIPGSGWDFNMSRHRYHEIERPYGPHYTVYNRRFMACCFDKIDTEEGYWLLRQKAAVLHTGELPLQFKGPDAEALLNKLFTKDITKAKVGRCGYGLACYEDGGLITDGVFLRIAQDCFWHVQADGDFYGWARAHSIGMDVEISDPQINVSQVQGPTAMQILEAASDDGMPEPFGYFGIAKVKFGGQEVIITRTGYTNELGWEFYTEQHHNVNALWQHLTEKGAPFGISLFGLDSMHIRRIEAGILNAGSDFNRFTNPFEVGLGKFVDMDKPNFIGKAALEKAPRKVRLTGVTCLGGEPHIGGEIKSGDQSIGAITAGAHSPYLKQGIGIALMHKSGNPEGLEVTIECTDGTLHPGKLASLPLYDKQAEIPRGKRVMIPTRD